MSLPLGPKYTFHGKPMTQEEVDACNRECDRITSEAMSTHRLPDAYSWCGTPLYCVANWSFTSVPGANR